MFGRNWQKGAVPSFRTIDPLVDPPTTGLCAPVTPGLLPRGVEQRPMDPRLQRAVDLGRAVVHETRTEKITFLAGSLAYHAFISLLPLLVLVLVAITAFGNQGLERGFLAIVEGLLSPGGGDAAAADLFIQEIRTAGESTGVSLVGGAVLLWGTMRIFRGLDTAFSDIYETESENSFVDQLADGLLVLVAFVAAIVVAGALQRLVPAAAVGVGWRTARFLLLVAGLSLTLYPMYYVFPDSDVTPLEVVPGTLFTAVGLTILQSLFGLYLELSGSSGDSSLVAGVLVLLTWLYFTSLIVLEGAVFNAVLSNRSADVDVRPVFGGVQPQLEEDLSAVDYASVDDALTRLHGLLTDASSVTVTVDDESVSLPPPQTFETDTEERLFELGGGRLGLTLRWAADSIPPGAEAADGDGGDSAGEDTDSIAGNVAGDSDADAEDPDAATDSDATTVTDAAADSDFDWVGESGRTDDSATPTEGED